MPQSIAYYCGDYVPAEELAMPVSDIGFVLGTTVTEQLRTFGGRLFRLEQHLERLRRSLDIVEVDPALSDDDFAHIAARLLEHNLPAAAGGDLGLAILITPGDYPTLAAGDASGPRVVMHTYRLPFELWADKYRQGEALATPRARQVSAECWPRELKCRSRMHYYLADKQARKIDPTARALMLDEDGQVLEATTASVVLYRQRQGLLSPPAQRILPGVSASMVADLARQLKIPFSHRPLWPADVVAADEVLLASTSSALLPVVRVDNRPIADGRPGPMFARLLAAWSDAVGLDIRAQAEAVSG